MESLVHLFNEIGMLAHLPRSGFAFLGTGKQSVAEHSHRMSLIAFALASLSTEKVNMEKLLLMCLIHDLPETRTGDLNYVNKRYVTPNESLVLEELSKKNPLGKLFAERLQEYNDDKTIEAHLAHDADKIEMLLVLKELHDLGNPKAMDWFESAAVRIKTDLGKKLVQTIRNTPSDEWWREHPHH